MTKVSKILLVDDQKSIREQLIFLLCENKGFQIVGTADSGDMAIEQVEILQPDIILLDVQMPGMNGVETTRVVNNRFPNTKIIFFTSSNHLVYFENIEDIDIAATIVKGSPAEEIIHTIEDVDRSKVKRVLNFSIFRKHSILLMFFLSFGIAIAIAIYLSMQSKRETTFTPKNFDPIQNKAIQTNRVVALGKIVPKGQIIKLSAANAENNRVNQLLVKEGDLVEKNQVIAILQGIDRRERDLEEAKKNVELARVELEKTLIGDTKQAELAAQKSNISRLESQLRNETIELQAVITSAISQLKQANLTYDRNKSLREDGVVSQQALDQSKESLNIARASLIERKAQLSKTQETLQAEITQEQGNLAALQEVKAVDIKLAKIQLERALIAVKQLKLDLEDIRVKAPISGQILRINTRVGEQIDIQQGIVELGQTNEMYAIAEVYETDIGKVKVGQLAIIKSEYGGYKGNLRGKVEHLGLQIGSRQLSEPKEDPTQDENSRIVEVKIRIDPQDSKKVAGLTNMKVRVEISNPN